MSSVRELLPAQVNVHGALVDNNVTVARRKLNSIVEIICPICLGPLEKTWTIMACLHRFCFECFHRSLRMDLGPNSHKECPLCRVKLASRRSSRPDPQFDVLVSLLSSHSTNWDDDKQCHDSEDSFLDLSKYRRRHEEAVAVFRRCQGEKRKLSQRESSSSSPRFSADALSRKTMPPTFRESLQKNPQSKTNCSVDYRGIPMVRLALHPRKGVGLNPFGNLCENVDLPRPYLTVPEDFEVVDVKAFVDASFPEAKLQCNTKAIYFLHDGKWIILKENLTVGDICLQYWDGQPPFALYFERQPL